MAADGDGGGRGEEEACREVSIRSKSDRVEQVLSKISGALIKNSDQDFRMELMYVLYENVIVKIWSHNGFQF